MSRLGSEFSYCLYSSMELGELTPDQGNMFNYLPFNPEMEEHILYRQRESKFSDIIDSGYYFWYNNIATKEQKSDSFYSFVFESNYTLREIVTHLTNILTDTYIYLKYGIKPKEIGFNDFLFDYIQEILASLPSLKKPEDILKLKNISELKNTNHKMGKIIQKFIYHFNVLNHNNELTLEELFNFKKEQKILIDKEKEKSIANESSTTPVKKSLKISKSEKKSARKALYRGYKAMGNIVGKYEVTSFVKGEQITIEGQLFKYKLQQRKNSKSLEELTLSPNKMHIPYDLNIFDKEDNFLSNACVYFKETPIIDQVIGLYIHVKNNEEKFIEKANLFKIQDIAWENKDLVRLKLKRKKESKKTFNLEKKEEISTSELKLNKEKIKIKEKIKEVVTKSIFYKTKIPMDIRNLMFSFNYNFNTLSDSFGEEGNIEKELLFLNKYSKKKKEPINFNTNLKENPNHLISYI